VRSVHLIITMIKWIRTSRFCTWVEAHLAENGSVGCCGGGGLRVCIGLVFGVQGLVFWVPGIGYRVSSIGYRVSGIGYQVSGIRSGISYRVSGIGYRVSGIGYRVSGDDHGAKVVGDVAGCHQRPTVLDAVRRLSEGHSIKHSEPSCCAVSLPAVLDAVRRLSEERGFT